LPRSFPYLVNYFSQNIFIRCFPNKKGEREKKRKETFSGAIDFQISFQTKTSPRIKGKYRQLNISATVISNGSISIAHKNIKGKEKISQAGLIMPLVMPKKGRGLEDLWKRISSALRYVPPKAMLQEPFQGE